MKLVVCFVVSQAFRIARNLADDSGHPARIYCGDPGFFVCREDAPRPEGTRILCTILPRPPRVVEARGDGLV
jgi:hypothetical protein